MVLGDMGAEVIKIEPPEPVANRIMPGPNLQGESFYHLAFNRSKKSVTLDLRTDSGQGAFRDLIRISDVFWSNLRPESVKNISADYETVSRINPSIVACYLSGYGLSGEYRNRPAFDINGLSLSGFMSVTGHPGGTPLRPGAPIGDFVTGMLGATGTCGALLQRQQTGKGQLVDVSLLDSCMATLAYEFTYYFCGGNVPRALGNGHFSIHPYNAYNTQNGWLAIGPSWPRLARVLGLDWMIDDPRFATTEARLENREEFDRIVQEKFMEAPAADWLELLHIEDIAATPVNTIDKTAADPQVRYRNMILEMHHALGEKMRMVGNPIKMPGSIDDTTYTPPPTLGQDNEEILGGLLGYSREKVDRIIDEGKRNSAELNEHLHKQM
jgi:crotonobetainyl-CoA:carnitine CoA-transferase CaiB-like acyl-CoA transferase